MGSCCACARHVLRSWPRHTSFKPPTLLEGLYSAINAELVQFGHIFVVVGGLCTCVSGMPWTRLSAFQLGWWLPVQNLCADSSHAEPRRHPVCNCGRLPEYAAGRALRGGLAPIGVGPTRVACCLETALMFDAQYGVTTPAPSAILRMWAVRRRHGVDLAPLLLVTALARSPRGPNTVCVLEGPPRPNYICFSAAHVGGSGRCREVARGPRGSPKAKVQRT